MGLMGCEFVTKQILQIGLNEILNTDKVSIISSPCVESERKSLDVMSLNAQTDWQLVGCLSPRSTKFIREAQQEK